MGFFFLLWKMKSQLHFYIYEQGKTLKMETTVQLQICEVCVYYKCLITATYFFFLSSFSSKIDLKQKSD